MTLETGHQAQRKSSVYYLNKIDQILILEGADGGVRDHYTPKKVAQSGGICFLSTLCIILWGSVTSNLTIQGLQNSKKVDAFIKIQLDLKNSTWKNPQKNLATTSIHERFSVFKIIKNGSRSSENGGSQTPRRGGGGPPPIPTRPVSNFILGLM